MCACPKPTGTQNNNQHSL